MAAQNLDLKVGEEVDFYRELATKDASGWFGPAEVADVSRAARGIISARHHARTLEVKAQRIRRHLQFIVFLA